MGPAAAMTPVAGAAGCGLRIGAESDLAAGQAIRFRKPASRERIVTKGKVSRAGTFLARAVMDVIEGRQPDAPALYPHVPGDTGRMPRPD